MMTAPLILANLSNLTETGSSIQKHASYVEQQQAILQAVNAEVASVLIGPLAPAAFAFWSALLRTGTVMDCLDTALDELGTNLHNTVLRFQTTDATLASLFRQLDHSLQPYTGFEQQPQEHPGMFQRPTSSASSAPSWWSKAVNAAEASGLKLLGVAPIMGGANQKIP